VTPPTQLPDAEPSVAARRRGVGRWVKLAFLVAVVLLGALVVARRWDELRVLLGRLSPLAVLGAVGFAAVAQIAAMRAYRTILADLGAPLPVVPTGRVFFVSQLGKYLPGTVWAMVALVSMSREYHIMRKTSLAAGLLAMAFSIATAFAVATVLLPLGSLRTAQHLWFAGLMLPLLVVGLHPRVVSWVLDFGLRLAGRQPLPDRMSYAGTLRAAGWQTLSWLLFGLHAWSLVLGIGGPGTRSLHGLATTVGGFALSYGAGPLFVVAPAGAGVRETAIVLTLGPLIGGAAALAVALVSRAVLVFVDFSQALVWSLVARHTRSGRPTDGSANSGDTGKSGNSGEDARADKTHSGSR
jgi:glycosyltransferase 2 family protein